MPLFTYSRDIPDAPNNPSADQPDMKINTNSIDTLIDQDHFSFNQNQGGQHKQVRIYSRVGVPPALDPALPGGTVYAKEVTTAPLATESQLFYRSDQNNPSEYQITRAINANFSTFSTNTFTSGNTSGAGWTFLPGGLIMFYGAADNLNPNADTPVVFPFNFPSAAFAAFATMRRNSSSETGAAVNSLGLGGFNIRGTFSGAGNQAYWWAIGK